MPPETEAQKLARIEAKLRRTLGNISTSQLSEDQTEDAVLSAISEYSRYRPIKVLDSLTTVKDEGAYDLSAKERIINVKEVFYDSSLSSSFDEYWPDPLIGSRLEGLSIFENPSLWTQYIQRLEQYRYMFSGSFEFDESGKILTLIPAPSSTGRKVYYVWLKEHVALTVPERDTDTLLLWAKAEAKDMLGSKMSTEIRSVSGFGQSVTLGATSESITEESEGLRERFRKKFGRTYISIG